MQGIHQFKISNMKTFKLFLSVVLTALLFSCGKSPRQLLVNEWRLADGHIMDYAPLYKYYNNKDSVTEFYKIYGNAINSRMFNLNEDGTFVLKYSNGNELKGKWEHVLDKDKQDNVNFFTDDGMIFEIWTILDFRVKNDCKCINYIKAIYRNDEFAPVFGGLATNEIIMDIVPGSTDGFEVY